MDLYLKAGEWLKAGEGGSSGGLLFALQRLSFAFFLMAKHADLVNHACTLLLPCRPQNAGTEAKEAD